MPVAQRANADGFPLAFPSRRKSFCVRRLAVGTQKTMITRFSGPNQIILGTIYHLSPKFSKRSSKDQVIHHYLKIISIASNRFILGQNVDYQIQKWSGRLQTPRNSDSLHKPYLAIVVWLVLQEVQHAPLHVRTLTSPLCLPLASILLAQEDSSSWLEDIVPPFLDSFLAEKKRTKSNAVS